MTKNNEYSSRYFNWIYAVSSPGFLNVMYETWMEKAMNNRVNSVCTGNRMGTKNYGC